MLKRHSSDLVLHFYKVGGLARDVFTKEWSKIKTAEAETSWLLSPSMSQASKTLDLTIPKMQLKSFFYETIPASFMPSSFKVHASVHNSQHVSGLMTLPRLFTQT